MKIFETKTCTGCKTCEIACSFHHCQTFSTSLASIEIIPIEEKLTFDILLHEEDKDGHLACNGCSDEAELFFCVKYCPAIAQDELSNIIQEFQRAPSE